MWFQETIAELQDSPTDLLLPEDMQRSLEEFMVHVHVHFTCITFHMYILYTHTCIYSTCIYMYCIYMYMYCICASDEEK